MNSSNRALKITALLFGLLFIVLLLFSLVGRKSIQTSQAVTVPHTFASTTAFGTNSVIFSNGQTLATYNYVNGKLKLLGPTGVGLSSIDTISVSPDNNYVLFHDGLVSAGGSLASQLTQQGLNPSLDYWWLYSVQGQTFRPLPQGALLAQVDNNTIYALSTVAGAEYITTYATLGLHQSSIISIPGSSNFFPAENGFLLQTPDNKVLFTSDGVVNKVLFTSTTLVGVTADKQSALAVTAQGGSRNLVTINLRSNATTTIASNIVNMPVWLNSGDALYATNSGQLYSYNLAAHKSDLWQFSGNLHGLNIAEAKLISLVGPSIAVVSDQSNSYYIIGSGLAATKAL